nr:MULTISPECIES: hypothetical protein [unclassified Methylosinus]
MPAGKDEKLYVEPLASGHDRSGFESAVEVLDRYFRTQSGQDARKNMAAPFVLALPDGTIAGYYTLSSTSVQLAELPEQPLRKLPKYPRVPATLMGRLAVDRRLQGKGYGPVSTRRRSLPICPERDRLVRADRGCEGR